MASGVPRRVMLTRPRPSSAPTRSPVQRHLGSGEHQGLVVPSRVATTFDFDFGKSPGYLLDDDNVLAVSGGG